VTVKICTAGSSLPDWRAKGQERILQNIRNLTVLARYEVAYNRTLGLSPDLVDLSLPELEARYAAELTELIEDNEPRAVVREISGFTASPKGEISCEVVIGFA
jgi:hypothetical protein